MTAAWHTSTIDSNEIMIVVFLSALQLLSVSQTTGNHHYDQSVGVDFTLYSPVEVSAVGLIDADEPGINGTLVARVFDRSNGQVVIGPVFVSAGAQRLNDSNPFVFVAMQAPVRLQRGVYCLVAAGFVEWRDRYINQGTLDANITDVDIRIVKSPAVAVTAGVFGGDGNGSVLPTNSERDIYAAATLVFSIVDTPAIGLPPQREFADCEAVACAGLPTGEYNIRGQVRYCDDGWMRLWSVNDSTCESNDWSSARNPFAAGLDPFGCRPINTTCRGKPIVSPFPFNEVRGANWFVWSFGSPGAFNSRVFPCEGIVVRGGNGTVWTLAAGFRQYAYGRCPCEPILPIRPIHSCDSMPLVPTGPAIVRRSRRLAAGFHFFKPVRRPFALVCVVQSLAIFNDD